MMLETPSPYLAPFRIVSIAAGDSVTIANLTPDPHGANRFEDLRGAGGVCIDIRKRIADKNARIVDANGKDVPETAWMPAIVQARRGF